MFILSSMSLQASWGLGHTHIKLKKKYKLNSNPKQSHTTQYYHAIIRWQTNCMNLRGEGITMDL